MQGFDIIFKELKLCFFACQTTPLRCVFYFGLFDLSKRGVRRFLPHRLVFHPRKHPSLVRSTDSCSGPICRGRGADVAARCAASIFREIENVISEFPPSSAGSASSSSSSPTVRCGDRFPADMRQTFNEAHVKSFHRKPEFHVGNVRQSSGQDTLVPIPLSPMECARF